MTTITAHICERCGHAETRSLDDAWTYCPQGCYGSIMRPVAIELPAEVRGLLSPYSNPSIERYAGLAAPGRIIVTAVAAPVLLEASAA
jgi:hypothetical protein